MFNALLINMYILPVIILYVYLSFVVETTNITTSRFLTDPESLTSNDSTFRIGFFSPVESTSRYVGIWYNNDPESGMLEVIWVANRDNPLNDSSGVLKISENGDLQVIDGKNTTVWSSDTTTTSAAATVAVVAQLLDTGNLVLISNPRGLIIWQSFDHPTDSWLPSVKFTVKQETKENPMLRSWKSDSDPSSGTFRFGIVPRTLPEFFTLKGDRPYWRSGPWNGYLYIGIPNMNSEVSTGFNIIDDHDGSLYVAYSVLNRSILERYMINFDGVVLQKDWDFAAKRWVVKWESIGSECDVYGKCGAFGICDPTGSPICKCLTGFRPRKVKEWRQGNWTSGCTRTAELHCDSTEKKKDVFLKLEHMKVPDYSEWISANDQGGCGNKCLGDCSCLAYAYYSGIGCMIWNQSLIDIQHFSGDGADLFIRLAHSALSEQSRKWRVIVGVLVIMSSAVFVALMYFIWRRINQRRELKSTAKEKAHTWQANMKIAGGGRNVEFGDLPLFDLETLITATSDFSEGNKLGQGGFGPVYKGELEDGQQIAVKRLSKASGQGIEEFMNEVVVISKLQHKNLVKLLGCCVEGEEKLLVYEYMQNKSLDSFLFDSRHKEQLDWEKRLSIIKGICRGLLYLHRDSRLRIIHRDLKASNILLDEGLDPKISDFGMARIFDPKQDQAKTLRIAGTYGYMSPEYAMEGRFSEKSDVYSLGVLLLEIVSGKKNYFLYEETLNLLAYAWKLWNENEMLSFIDQTISDPSCQAEILRCIQLGLLCVQELPHDRPNVSTLLYLLDNNTMAVPDPKQPGFTQTKPCSEDNVSQDGQECSVNHVTVTAVSCR